MITNKKIVLTGASSGIGFEVLKLLAASGDNKILAVARNVKPIEEAKLEGVIPFSCDVSSKEGVDAIFAEAIDKLGSIDIFFANAGFAYYEEFNYVDWGRIEKLYATNVFATIYGYQKMQEHLNGREGQYAVTCSAMGKMGMPGYAVYSSSKFALNGFQESVRLEKHDRNLKLTYLYPVATDTGFFKRGAESNVEFKKPFPVQKPDYVARKMYNGLDKKKKSVNPCKLFSISRVLMTIFPFIKNIYWSLEYKKFEQYLAAKNK